MGGVTRRANEAGCSRQAAYKNAARLGRSLELLETHPDLEAILQENQRLGKENATLRKEAVRVSEDCQQEFAVTASAMGISITQITALLRIVLPESKGPGRTKIGDWVKKWAIKAGKILRVVDPVCRQQVEEACLVKKEASTVLARRWNKVEHLWNEAEKADRVVAEHKRTGQYALSPAQKARHAWQRAEEIFQEYERVESAWRRAEKALNVFCDDRTLNDRRRAEELIHEGVEGLPGEAWAKTCRMLQDPRALTFLDRLHRQLE